MRQAHIPILLLDGNHDRSGAVSAHRNANVALAEILRGRGADVHASQTSELVEVGPLQIVTLPWLNSKRDAAPAEADRLAAEWATNRQAELAESADP